MKIRKSVIISALFLFSLFTAFADETDTAAAVEPEAETESSEAEDSIISDTSEKKSLFSRLTPFLRWPNAMAKEDRTFRNTSAFTFEFTPGFYLNPNNENKGQSASSIYPFSVGLIWPDYTSFAFAPSISFFTMNHLFDDGTVYPAEIENRRSTTFNLIVNFPLNISLFFKKGTLQLAPGIMFLPRFAIPATGIGSSEELNNEISQINQWFWKNARFLYISTGVSYMLNLSEAVKGGPVIHTYIPVGTIFSGESIQGMIVSFGMKIQM